MAKKRVLSGIAASAEGLHIGNYFGAVKPHIELLDKGYEAYYFIADLHALTTVQDKKKLEENIKNIVLDYLALGLDPKKCVFFRQSDIPEHSQLATVFANYVFLGQMKRMHAFKDKLQKGEKAESVNMGLFNYPILMAADILLYKPDIVPVGEDQRQHVEVARDIAERFNKIYGVNTFPLPEVMISKEAGKIVGTDGKRKMSKSLGNIIGIFENEKEIKRQIMSSYTDPKRIHPTDPGKVEGNPVFDYHDLMNDDKKKVESLKKKYREGKIGDVEVKEELFSAHKRLFKTAREKRKRLEKNPELVRQILEEGAKKARNVAGKTLDEVYGVIGIKSFR